MHKLNAQFDELRSAIEPATARKTEAKKADDPVREHLQSHDSFSEHHVATFLYGSYKRRTAICDIKDVDLVVVTNFSTDDDPVDVLNALKNSLRELYDGAELADQRRSIRVNRPLPDDPDSELTLDVIPAIYQDEAGGPLWVPDREKTKWIESHPQGHIDFTSELNADSHQGNSFVRLSKMMKWWWQYQWVKLGPSAEEHLRKPKGFWIEMTCGEFADLTKESYPEMIVALLENAFAEFESFRQTRVMPELPDPGLPDQTIQTSMTDNEFSVFLDVLEQALIDARAGVGAKTEREAAQQWRKLFGDKFPLPTEESKSSSLLKAAVTPGGLSFPAKPLIPSKPAGFA
jgi:predicted nucleotidyltransferase